MPITKSARKALRQNLKHKVKNRRVKNKIKTLVKQQGKLLIEKKTDEARSLLPQVYKALDKAAKAGVIKKNTASRRKSRLTHSIQRLDKTSKES